MFIHDSFIFKLRLDPCVNDKSIKASCVEIAKK